MNRIVEGNLYVTKTGLKWFLRGFTSEDMLSLGRVARKHYKLKTKRKRIVKKYIVKLLSEALKDFQMEA